MALLKNIGREFSGYNILESGKRLFDRKPLQCSLYLTDRCNLDCSYCTEYDNSRPHPKLEDLKIWIRKIRDLGTMRIALVGGEPLLHPNVVEIVRYCRELGFATSLTTNGFLLTRQLLAELEEAGLQVMQISVDRMTPSPVTKKSFKTILPKLDYFKDSKISLHITGVICQDTLPESKAVLETGFSRGIPTEVRLVHADPLSRFRVARGSREELEEFVDSLIERKRAGEKIHTNEAILNYQRSLLRERARGMDLHGGLQTFLCLRAGKILGVQHGAHGQTHSRYHAGRSLRELPQEDLPGGLRCLLRGQHVTPGRPTSDRLDERNRLTRAACAWNDPGFAQIAQNQSAPREPRERQRSRRPTGKGHESASGNTNGQAKTEEPDVNVAPSTDVANKAIERRDVVQVPPQSALH